VLLQDLLFSAGTLIASENHPLVDMAAELDHFDFLEVIRRIPLV